jgi:hypothetical protein
MRHKQLLGVWQGLSPDSCILDQFNPSCAIFVNYWYEMPPKRQSIGATRLEKHDEHISELLHCPNPSVTGHANLKLTAARGMQLGHDI